MSRSSSDLSSNINQATLAAPSSSGASAALDRFSYPALNQHFNAKDKFFMHGDYGVMVLPGAKNFIGFNFMSEIKKDNDSEEKKILFDTGIKFHISLPEGPGNTEMLHKGWDVVKTVLMQHGVESFKVKRDTIYMYDEPGQQGKIITVYAQINKGAEEWQIVFQDLTEKLTVAGIPPGYRPTGSERKPERILNGSHYVTYRFEDEVGRMKSYSEQEKNTLLDGNKQLKLDRDPIAKIKISVANQKAIPFLDFATKVAELQAKPALGFS